MVIFAGLYWIAKGRKSYQGPVSRHPCIYADDIEPGLLTTVVQKLEVGIDAAFNSQLEQVVKTTETKA